MNNDGDEFQSSVGDDCLTTWSLAAIEGEISVCELLDALKAGSPAADSLANATHRTDRSDRRRWSSRRTG